MLTAAKLFFSSSIFSLNCIVIIWWDFSWRCCNYCYYGCCWCCYYSILDRMPSQNGIEMRAQTVPFFFLWLIDLYQGVCVYVWVLVCLYVRDCQTRIKCRPNTSDAIREKKINIIQMIHNLIYMKAYFLCCKVFKCCWCFRLICFFFCVNWWCCHWISIFHEQ